MIQYRTADEHGDDRAHAKTADGIYEKKVADAGRGEIESAAEDPRSAEVIGTQEPEQIPHDGGCEDQHPEGRQNPPKKLAIFDPIPTSRKRRMSISSRVIGPLSPLVRV